MFQDYFCIFNKNNKTIKRCGCCRDNLGECYETLLQYKGKQMNIDDKILDFIIDGDMFYIKIEKA